MSVFARLLQRRGRLLLPMIAILVLTDPVCAEAANGRNLLRIHQEKHRELRARFVADLEQVAKLCEQQRYTVEAAEIRRLAVPPDPQVLSLGSLPEQVQPDIPLDLPPAEREWRSKLRRVRTEYAKDLYLHSRRVLAAGFSSYAYQLIREVVHHDPDHKVGRRLLGYERQGERWMTFFAAAMERKHFVWTEQFGWLPKGHVERYENGERNFNGVWVSARKEAELRRDFNNCWEVRTEHFLVKTNHSLERGIEVAKALEAFHEVFFQTFAGFFNTPEQLQKLFAGSTSSSRRASIARPHEVHYYATRDEYNERLVSKIPQIAITNGLYFTNDRTSYFYHDPAADNDATLFHEATHQLFYESMPRDRAVGEKEHFWIIEGIACYMESFEYEDGHVSLGNPKYVRFDAARYRYLNDNYYVPLAPFSAMGMREFQTDQNISRNYSQAAGLAHFFMHYEDGRYRDALIAHLSQQYTTSLRSLAGVQSLAELTGVSFDELDRQYGQYVRQVELSVTGRLPEASE